MNYQDLADDASNNAWEAFQLAEGEYRKDPTNKEKWRKSREAFYAYDRVRMKLYFPKEIDDKNH